MGGPGGRNEVTFRIRLFVCLMLFILFLIPGVSGNVFAQEGDDEFVLDEIVITGSRIARNNNESSSPIVTVDEKLFDNSASMAIEAQLNKLPQFTPTIDVPQVAGQDIQPNARNTPGEATVALRGIGSNRTLVLINGRRGTPSNALGVLDINTIPTAAIEYVEAISGGASSTYGADAMAGVLNFIMRDHFEGFQVDMQAGITEEGDNFDYRIAGVMGSNIADDRGNVSIAFSFNDRNEAFQRDRDWYRELWANPTVGGTQYFMPYSGYVTSGSNLPSVAALNANIDGATFTAAPAGTTIFDDGNGNAWSGFDVGGVPGVTGANIADGYNVILQANGQYGINNTSNYLIYPLKRYNMYLNGNYKINESVGTFFQGYFSKTRTFTRQEPTPITGGWAVLIDPTVNDSVSNGGMIPDGIWNILQSRDNGGGVGSGANDTFELKGLLPFPRTSETDVYTYNMVGGLEGDIKSIDWTWEVFVSHGEAETTVIQGGFASLQRFKQVITGNLGDIDYDGSDDFVTDFGKGWYYTGNPGAPGYGFGASSATCTSGLNPFDWSSVSQDCWDAILANIKTKQIMEQNILEGNAQGSIVELPAGEMRGAIGLSYRENIYEYQNDTLVTAGTSFLEQSMGLYPSANSEGKIEVKEEYAELLVPILSDLPFVESLNLEFGGRRSDYDTTGVSYTYKALFDYKTNGWLRFRGGYNRAERAPNIAELYLAKEQSFAFTTGDPASTKSPLAYSANPDTNPENWHEAIAIQGQLMENTGNTNSDDLFYGTDYRNLITPAVIAAVDGGDRSALDNLVTNTNTQGSIAFGVAFPYLVGNPNLEPEVADTWTFGVIIDSFIDDIPALMDWRVSLDYYTIKVKDAIGQQSAGLVMRQCIDSAFNPTFDINSEYCAGYKRNAAGAVGALETSFFNNGRFETSGIDLQINWGMEIGPGRLNVDSMINYLLKMESAELDILPLVDYVGTAGPGENGLNGNSFEWRALTTFTYTVSDLGLSLRWQHLDSLMPASAATTSVVNSTGTDSYDMFDLTGTYRVSDSTMLRFGIENIFGIEPDLNNIDYSNSTGMYGGSFDASNQDLNGRRFYVGARVYF